MDLFVILQWRMSLENAASSADAYLGQELRGRHQQTTLAYCHLARIVTSTYSTRKENLSHNQLQLCMRKVPRLLDVIHHCYSESGTE